MKTLKRLSALVLSLVLMVACFAGCHEKGEIAVKIGDIQFTSGYYACALFFANEEARQIVNEQVSVNDSVPAELDYTAYKVEETDYVTWVENTAISNLKRIAFVKNACQKANITLDTAASENAELTADYQWEVMGTQLENNGISKDTMTKYISDLYLEDVYFEHLYGEGGEKEVTTEEIQKQLTEHYCIANILKADFTSLNEEDRDEKRTEFQKYEEELKEDPTKFEEIYATENGEHEHDESAEDQDQPKDLHATIISDTNDNYSYEKQSLENYDVVKKMEIGEVKLVTLEDDEGLLIIVKKDILEDPYYIENFDTTIRVELKQEEFTNFVTDESKKLTADINDFAVNQFDVKKIEYVSQ